MISSYNSALQTLDTNENLVFSTNRVLTGCTVTHNEGSEHFRLNKPGYYFVSFNGDVATFETAGNVVVSLLNNGVVVPGASATSYSAASTDVQNLDFSTIIRVAPSCHCVDNSAVLTIQNTGIEASYVNVNVVITKLC